MLKLLHIHQGKEVGGVMRPTMGLYIEGDNCAQLVVLGKVCDAASTIHNVHYGDDVLKVSVAKFYHGDAQVPILTSEIQYVRQALDTFIAWPTHLVKLISDEVFIFFNIIKRMLLC